MRSKTFQIETLGCKVNQYDSQRLAEMLENAGFSHVPPGETPDLWFVNTCTVTHAADRKARQLIRRQNREAPRSGIFVTGCYATLEKDLIAGIDGVNGVYGPDEWDRMLEAVCSQAGTPPPGIRSSDFGLNCFRGRARACVKIQDGCDAFCSYCIVPHVRGRPRSRPLEDALEEGRRMIGHGFRELVLTGVHLGLYGRDLSESVELADVVSAFAALDRHVRIRLSSLEGPEANGRLLAAMTSPNVCPHLHLPLQSADAEVLRAMGRSYGPVEFYDVLETVRAALPDPAISTDIIVGFPGESDRAFRNTLEFCENAGFSRIHVFNYSPRPNTVAYGIAPRIDQATAGRRSEALRSLAGRLGTEWASKFLGRNLRVLYEKTEPDGWMCGYSDRYVRVKAPADAALLGNLTTTSVHRQEGCELMGRIGENATGQSDD